MSLSPGDLIEITAEGVAHGGWCVARPPGEPVVFVRHALPGERVVARVTEVTRTLTRADAVEVLDASPDRVVPPCPYARPGACGGCDWQHASPPAQRALKAAVVQEQLHRLAKVDRPVTVEELPSANPNDPSTLGWRTRLQFAVDDSGRAGLRAHRSHEVVDIDDCLIAHPAIRALEVPRHRWPGAIAVEALCSPGGDSGETQIIVVSERRPAEVPDVGAESVLSRYGRKQAPVRGRAYLTQQAAGREWRVSAGGFWQVHPAAADTLTTAVLAALEPKPGDSVLDLYCGAGLFAGTLAAAVGRDGQVTGVESDEAAVRDARHNLREFPWASIHRGDVGAVLGGTRPGGAGKGRPGLPPARLVVADPPRSGLDRRVIGYLAGEGSGAERFCYVSCDPATLARDTGLLLERGWQLDGLRAFDAFPMTHHVECVAAFTRSS